ncbi:sulfoxide reductase heme-binding subunit YedZ [Ketobacter sp. MCCC 1A13808]|uniref:sulfite oxidase heme-binding subunit YedZ n=1 Tax=Ketobacter sp. MCCC 1A13808 TaxID=2602738 RepID=UPI000F0F70FF|nr:protein-methionine-sulfoxide reductase heme-binding subunit MsrQ [Ketobacter sp. MCCC 1A13808]MVF14757.1 sulfoxide reductase heme-binding subunit YedZ [Ketobacter sp. MCCC 1A13808]RLP52661.1 MAG: sulfoxide reductase heme-binding subunit YedZ [Ketobacter sp.]
MKKNTIVKLRWGLHILLALPFFWVVYLVVSGDIGTDPAEKIVREFGFDGACILWLSLAMTPLRKLTGNAIWIAFRRPLGLWSFFYLSLHLCSFLVFWAGLDFQVITEELSERPYIYIGVAAWVLLVPLAVTSTQRSRRRLGKKWNQLHRLVYLSGALAVLHIVWVSKLDYVQPLIFGFLFIAFMLLRTEKIKNILRPAKS